MRRIVSAITVAALALSLVASATQANAAVAGYDSAYAGESAFLNLQPGQSGTFTVFFANTGATSWVRGSGSQVDLAACLEDKVTCNAQDATEAPFNSGWLSATRYTTQTQTTVAPGQIGTFTYNVAVPAAQAAGTYRFNGALVLASSGADIRNEGYYQDVTVTTGAAAGTASITSINPTTGSTAGGTPVTISGSGFVCTPAFPTVNFGTNAATVTSCGATSLSVTSPAGAAGTVQVTVTNQGAAASNGVSFTYADTTKPTYNSVTVAGNVATVTFSEAVCRTAAWAGTDWTVTVNGIGTTYEDTTDSIPDCNSTFSNGVTSANLFLAQSVPNGAFVAVTLETTGGAKMRDTAGNTATAPRSNTTTATSPESTRPTITSASATGGSTTLTLTFSEPVYCTALEGSEVTATSGSTTLTSTTTDCPTTPQTAKTTVKATMNGAFTSGSSYSVTVTTETDEIQDVQGNDLASPATASFTAGAADASAPLLNDTRVSANAGLTTNMDSGDAFTITFSEPMSTTTAGDQFTVEDADTGSVDSGVITCGTNATCSFNSDATVLTITITGTVGANDVGYPATIISTTGVTDAAGNAPNLGGSPDRIIDFE